MSDAPAWVVSHANVLADLRGWTSFVGVQAQYSLIERSAERDLLPMADALGLAFVVWAPLGAGLLTGKYLDDASRGRLAESEMYRGLLTERNAAIARAVVEIARATGCSATQVALVWLQSRNPRVIPIVGARSQKQLADSLGALGVTLTPDALSLLEEASAVSLGFPHDFLQWDTVRGMVYGGTYDAIVR